MVLWKPKTWSLIRDLGKVLNLTEPVVFSVSSVDKSKCTKQYALVFPLASRALVFNRRQVLEPASEQQCPVQYVFHWYILLQGTSFRTHLNHLNQSARLNSLPLSVYFKWTPVSWFSMFSMSYHNRSKFWCFLTWNVWKELQSHWLQLLGHCRLWSAKWTWTSCWFHFLGFGVHHSLYWFCWTA